MLKISREKINIRSDHFSPQTLQWHPIPVRVKAKILSKTYRLHVTWFYVFSDFIPSFTPLLTSLQPQWSPSCSSNILGTLPDQDHSINYSFCLNGHSQIPRLLTLYFIQVTSTGGCDGRAIAQAAATWRAVARPRGATPRLRSGAEAGRTPCPKGSGQVELPHLRDQGQRPRIPDCHGTGTAERSYPTSEVGGAAKRRFPASEVRGGDERSYPASEVRGGGREELPHAPKPEARGSGQEELPHTPCLRPGAAAGRSNPHRRPGAARRGVNPPPRSGAAARRRYPTPQARGQGQRAGGDTPRP